MNVTVQQVHCPSAVEQNQQATPMLVKLALMFSCTAQYALSLLSIYLHCKL